MSTRTFNVILSFIGAIATMTVVAMVWIVASIVVEAQTTRPLFVIGDRIGVVLGCMPPQFATTPGAVACYSEVLRVKEVRADGWLRVVDEIEMVEWFVNPNQIYAFRRDTTGAAAE